MEEEEGQSIIKIENPIVCNLSLYSTWYITSYKPLEILATLPTTEEGRAHSKSQVSAFKLGPAAWSGTPTSRREDGGERVGNPHHNPHFHLAPLGQRTPGMPFGKPSTIPYTFSRICHLSFCCIYTWNFLSSVHSWGVELTLGDVPLSQLASLCWWDLGRVWLKCLRFKDN